MEARVAAVEQMISEMKVQMQTDEGARAKTDALRSSETQTLHTRVCGLETASAFAKELIEKAMDSGGTGKGGHEPKAPMPLTQRRGLEKVSKYGGRAEVLSDWKFAMMNFMEDCIPEFGTFLTYIEKLPGADLTEAEVLQWEAETTVKTPGVSAEWLSQQLYSLMASNTEGSALPIVKSYKGFTFVKGPNAWRALTKDAVDMTGQRHSGMVARIYSPARVDKMADIPAALAAWEELVDEYSKSAGAEVDPRWKKHALTQMVPLKMADDITKLSSVLTTYKNTKEWINSQVAHHKAPVFEKGGKDTALSRLAAMVDSGLEEQGEEHAEEKYECSPCGPTDPTDEVLLAAYHKGKGFSKGGKSHGKGPWVTIQFDGECNYCRIRGHKWADCRKRQSDVQNGRVEGTKSFSKGSSKGGSGSSYGGGGGGKSGGKGGTSQYPSAGKGNGGAFWFNQGPMVTSNAQFQAPTPAQGTQAYGHDWGCALLPAVAVQNRFDALAEDLSLPVCSVEGENNESYSSQVSVGSIVPPHADEPGMAKHHGVRPTWSASEGGKVTAKGPKMKRVAKGEWQALNSFLETSRHDGKQLACATLPKELVEQSTSAQTEILCPVGIWREADGYTRVRSVFDTGATKSVTPSDAFPEYPTQSSAGSREGRGFTTANNEMVANKGEQYLPAYTTDGARTVLHNQLADVSIPLSSVGEYCDAGNWVAFGKYGGIIQDLNTGHVTNFPREEGIYVLEHMIPPPSKVQGFPRPGTS